MARRRTLILSIAVASLTVAGLAAWAQLALRGPDPSIPYDGSSFASVWGALDSESETNLVYPRGSKYPVDVLTWKVMGDSDVWTATKQTLVDPRDLWPRQRLRMLRPNGICLAGTWRITAETPYTGYFAKDAEGLVIARASVAPDGHLRGQFRSFGMGVKIFPTLDAMKQVKTANFFVIDDVVGTKLDHFLDAPMTNKPRVRPWRGLQLGWDIIKAFLRFQNAERKADKNTDKRQLYQVSRLGYATIEDALQNARTPKLIKLVGSPEQNRFLADDVRDELRVENYGGERILMDIHVAATEKDPEWTPIGQIEFFDDVVSTNCDRRLHFWHPFWEDGVR